MVYFSQLWQRTLNIASAPFLLDRWLLRLPQGWRITMNFSIRYTVDNAGSPPSTDTSTTYMPYVYSPLELPDQIRLLRIHPGEPEDPIETSLVTASLDVSPDYDALSYVWGSHADRCQIWVDGLTVLVPLGGFQALHSLRRSRCERLIWIDAFSINQEDLNDKSHQTGDAMRALQYLIQARTETAEPPWMHTELIDVEDVLQDILDRPWFKRIWTVQEATLARHTILVCGEHRLSWYGNLQSLRRIAFRIKSTAISPYFSVASGRKSKLDWSSLLDIVETQMRQAARREGAVIHRNQLDLAFQFRYRQSADPRDNYFALFGIVENENGGRLEFKPDYSISLKELHLRYMEEIQRISEIEDAPPSPTSVLHCSHVSILRHLGTLTELKEQLQSPPFQHCITPS
ncbi:hypothetical protein HBI75_202950 [Parastagonospora nodorum]|nr:hypothetical protein HBH63_164430 [Parastagonospora nodorum]KAH5011089.1 hypothetical protein HBI75_202950 [Parastagonospora nodorum]KAH5679758.1 hypothetical protein HBI21_073170 [Parastagonospora nodorum]KAH5962208.1 hypothetical protein HBI85_147200 [Parastagonospora nodorum]